MHAGISHWNHPHLLNTVQFPPIPSPFLFCSALCVSLCPSVTVCQSLSLSLCPSVCLSLFFPLSVNLPVCLSLSLPPSLSPPNRCHSGLQPRRVVCVCVTKCDELDPPSIWSLQMRATEQDTDAGRSACIPDLADAHVLPLPPVLLV